MTTSATTPAPALDYKQAFTAGWGLVVLMRDELPDHIWNGELDSLREMVHEYRQSVRDGAPIDMPWKDMCEELDEILTEEGLGSLCLQPSS